MRLIGLDIARFLAFAGMVLVNFRIVAGGEGASEFADLLPLVLEGRAAALFVVLAGIGISLADISTRVLIRRGLFLFAIGLLNMLIFPADILHYYGIYFLCIIPLLHKPPKTLLLYAAGITLVAFIALLALDYDAGWNWITYEYTDFWSVTGFLRNLFYNGWHPVFPWLTFLLFGMFLGRFSLYWRNVQVLMIAFGVGTYWVLSYLSDQIALQGSDLAFITNTTPIPPSPFYVLSACGSSAAVIGIILFLTPIAKRLRIGEMLAVTGRQSLTLYVAHIVIGMGIMDAMGWVNGPLMPMQVLNYSLGFILVCIIYANLWRRVAKRGPLELIMRRFD